MPFRVSKITKIYIQVFFKTAAQLSLQFFPQFQNFITLHTKYETHSTVKIVLIGWTWIISPKKIYSLGQYNYWVFPMIAHIHNKLLKKRADVQWDKNDHIGKKNLGDCFSKTAQPGFGKDKYLVLIKVSRGD